VLPLDIEEKEFLKDFRERLIKNCTDVLILAELNEGKTMSGCSFLTFFNEKFGIMLSPGTIYSKLYALERQGLLQINMESRRTVYSISNKGQKIMHVITSLNPKIQEFLRSLSSQI
jgi:DNA-binding PadR family transcriptional regulator